MKMLEFNQIAISLGLWILLIPSTICAQIHYRYCATDYESTDNQRAPQTSFSYNTEENTFSIKATGAQNIAFQMKKQCDGNYYINPDEYLFVVAGMNLQKSTSATQLWWINGYNNGINTPNAVFNDGNKTLIVWDLKKNVSINKNFDFTKPQVLISAFGQSFLTALGTTSSDNSQPSIITDINYYAPYEFAAQYPTLMDKVDYTPQTLTDFYKQKLYDLIISANRITERAESADTIFDKAIIQANETYNSLQKNDYNVAIQACTQLTSAIDAFQRTNHMGSYQTIDGGILAKFDDLNIKVSFVNDDVVHVTKYYGDICHKKSWVVLPEAQQKVIANVTKDGNVVTITNKNIELTYNLKSGVVEVYRTNGELLISEGQMSMTACKDGMNDSYRIKQNFCLDKDEAIFGMGQIQDGKLNRRGQSIYLVQDNRKICIPLFESSKNYTLYWDNYSPTNFVDNAVETSFSSTGTAIDYYVLVGNNSKELLRSLRNLTGNTKMPALWNFGLYQSKERYGSTSEVIDVLKRYRDEKVPIDCIVQDWQYWGDNNHWNAMEFLNPNYSNFQEMVDEVHNMNAKLMISVWPDFGPSTKQYDYLNSKGRLIPAQSWPTDVASYPYDAYDAETRDYYWSNLYSGIMSRGFDALWLDSTEPDYMGHSDNDFDYITGTGETWRALRNIYPLATVEGVYNHHRAQKELNNKRVSIMTRSGFLGMQRTGAYVWSADITSSWQTLANQIPAACNLSVSGLPFWNSDTGGFFVGNYGGGKDNANWRRLYTRWTQFSTFTPMFRFHGTDTPREVWQFGSRDDNAKEYDILLKYIKIRYRLVPYLYSQAHQIVTNGDAFMTALPLAFQNDIKTLDVIDEYMFGNSFLVAPVVEDLLSGRNVYLPKGEKWIDFWTGLIIEGGQTVFKNAPAHIIPLYVKAGSIIPWGPDVQYTTEKKWDDLEIRIYPGNNGSFVLYEDEGDNYNYENGKFTEIPFIWDDATQTLKIGTRKGSFDGMLRTRKFNIVMVNSKDGCGDEHAKTYSKTITYDGTEQTIHLSYNEQKETTWTELTSVITNPSFEENIKGWTVNCQTTWWGTTVGNGNGSPKATDGEYIFGVWDKENNKTANISQDIYVNKPGTYKLSVDMHVSNRVNAYGASSIRVGNQCIFANDTKTYFRDQISTFGTYDEYPMQTITLYFEVKDINQPINIGVSTDGAPGETWFKIDNFRLFYTPNITVNYLMSEEYGTIILPFNADIPNGMKVFSCHKLKDNSETQLQLDEVTSINACTPYIVQNDKSISWFCFSGEDNATDTYYEDGWLKGVFIPHTIVPDGRNYILQKNNRIGFYQVISDDSIINANHCFLTIPNFTNQKAYFLDESPLGIAINTSGKNHTTKIFSLNGTLIRWSANKSNVLNRLPKGIYILNGKKVFVK